MATLSTQNRFGKISRPVLLRLILLFATAGLSVTALVLPITLSPSSYPLEIGDVAPQDIQAPYGITYSSTVLTDQAIQSAEQSVSPVYLSVDTSITRKQIELLKVTLNYINSVRADTYASPEQKLNDLDSISSAQISEIVYQKILNLDDNRWQVIQDEAVDVLEQVMRTTIREDRLDDSRRNVPNLVSYSLPEDQASIVSDLVTSFIVPNSLYSAEQTDLARQEIAATVKPVEQSYISGETIVLRGQVINDVIWEALSQFDLVKPQSFKEDLVGSIVLVGLSVGFLILYLQRRKTFPMDDLRSLGLIALLFIVFLGGARYIIPNRTVLPYLYPLPAFALTISVLFNSELAMIFSLILSILAAYGMDNNLDLTFYFIMCSSLGVLAISRARRVTSYFWAAMAVGGAGMAVVIAYRLPDSMTDWIGIATLSGAALFNGLASASITLLFQYFFAQLLGLTTALQLLEISRPDHPLLQIILRNAPGTYQHSLQVSNLAEQAAEAIGADGLLTRVGAIYHDAGKAVNPSYFIENQVPGKLNRHDDVDPAISAATIIQHVSDGLILARKYHLPPRIRDFMTEHHGTMLTRYQYTKAVELAGGDPAAINENLFRYPGPTPRSRETALLMLADNCEARARAELPRDDDELRALIKRVFDYLQKEGQLDNTQLTFLDMNIIMDSFLNTLRGIYHPRIMYPELKPVSLPSETQPTGKNPPELNPPASMVSDLPK